MNELKKCPFCGYKTTKSPFIIKEKDYDVNIFDDVEKARQAEVWFHVVCLKCKARSGEKSSIDKAVEVWNTRSL